MNLKKAIWITVLFSISLLLLSFSSCTSQSTFKDETITAENKTEIQGKASTELTVEEARLLGQYLERSYPDLAENDLPTGRNLKQMIEEQRAVEATSAGINTPAAQAEAETEAPAAVPVKTAPAAPPKAKPADPPAQKTRQAEAAPAVQTSDSQPEAAAVASAGTSAPDVMESEPETTAAVPDNTRQADAAEVMAEEAVPALPRTSTFEVESGTNLNVRLIERISTETAVAGDWFDLELADDLLVGNQLIAPKGTRARGRVMEAQGAGKVKGLATISLTLTDLFIDDEQFRLKAETLTFQAEKTTGKDAAKVGVASGIGAVLGAIIGGKKGAVIGAGVGAGAGTTTVLATKGDQLVFDVEQIFRFRLTEGFSVEIVEEQ